MGVSFSSCLSQDVPNAADNRCFHDCPPHVTRACPRMFTTRNDLDGGSDFVVRKTIRLSHVSCPPLQIHFSLCSTSDAWPVHDKMRRIVTTMIRAASCCTASKLAVAFVWLWVSCDDVRDAPEWWLCARRRAMDVLDASNWGPRRGSALVQRSASNVLCHSDNDEIGKRDTPGSTPQAR